VTTYLQIFSPSHEIPWWCPHLDTNTEATIEETTPEGTTPQAQIEETIPQDTTSQAQIGHDTGQGGLDVTLSCLSKMWEKYKRKLLDAAWPVSATKAAVPILPITD